MAGSEEEKQLEVISTLTKQAIDEYEDLKRENYRTKEEFAQIKEERDDAVKKLKQLEKISQLVVEEVVVIQNHLEIEKTCRENAEAVASNLSKENKTLKRLSMKYQAKLGPNFITEEINIDDDDSISSSDEGSEAACSSLQYQEKLKELEKKLLELLEEKKTLSFEVENFRSQLQELNDEVTKEKQKNNVLAAEVLRQKKLLESYNRVSVLAVEEYEELHDYLEVEKEMRKKAEIFAHEMLVEQKKLKRQSQILLESTAPNQQLQKALDDIAKITQTLEQERIQHQQKVNTLEEQLESKAVQKEVTALNRQIELLEEQKKELEIKHLSAEEQVKDLKYMGKLYAT
ncbi:shootin-1-like [Protopterus annectens]|uniref:shootin-1-like n=1 Tax=Protopterus annectens TaxID=7888 RepID=UPI001CFAB867|nr:shootin-1-like [Protopterus annectens]